jgi:hypothetical protein
MASGGGRVGRQDRRPPLSLSAHRLLTYHHPLQRKSPPLIITRSFPFPPSPQQTSSGRSPRTAMRPLSYAPPALAPQPRASPGPGRGPRRPPCALPFSDAVRSAAATVAISLSLLVGDAAVVAAPQPPEVCRNGGAPVEEEVRGEAVTNEQLVEEAWEVVNESFLPDAGSRLWSPEMWMVSFFFPHCGRWQCISWFSRVPLPSHNVQVALSSRGYIAFTMD